MKYLYKNNIEVYSINLNKEKIIEYKKEKMKSIPEDERIFSGISFDEKNGLTDNKDRFYFKTTPRKTKTFYLYKSKSNKIIKENILNAYYEGKLIYLKAFKSNYLGETKYYLVDIPNTNKNLERKTFSGIIQVPEELYYLQLFLNEEYNLITNEAIAELKDLFTLEKVRELETNINKPNNNKIIRKLTRKQNF